MEVRNRTAKQPLLPLKDVLQKAGCTLKSFSPLRMTSQVPSEVHAPGLGLLVSSTGSVSN